MNMHMSMSMRKNTAMPANSPHVSSSSSPVRASLSPDSPAVHRPIVNAVTNAGTSDNNDRNHTQCLPNNALPAIKSQKYRGGLSA